MGYLGSVSLYMRFPRPTARKIARELTILEGQPPSILEQSNFIERHFAIIFFFKPKLKKNPKNALLSPSFLNFSFPRPYSDTRLWLGDDS